MSCLYVSVGVCRCVCVSVCVSVCVGVGECTQEHGMQYHRLGIAPPPKQERDGGRKDGGRERERERERTISLK